MWDGGALGMTPWGWWFCCDMITWKNFPTVLMVFRNDFLRLVFDAWCNHLRSTLYYTIYNHQRYFRNIIQSIFCEFYCLYWFFPNLGFFSKASYRSSRDFFLAPRWLPDAGHQRGELRELLVFHLDLGPLAAKDALRPRLRVSTSVPRVFPGFFFGVFF